MRTLIFLLSLVLLLSGCGSNPIKVDPATSAGVVNAVQQSKLDGLQNQLANAEKTIAVATADGKLTARLVAENDALHIQKEIAQEQKIEIDQRLTLLTSQIATSDKAVEAARVHDWQWRLYYAAMAFAALAIIAGVVRFAWAFLATPATWALSIFAGLATALTVLGKLLPYIVWFIDFIPYLLWPCGIIAGIYGLAVLRQWWLSHHSTHQLVQAVGGLVSKGLVSATAMEQHLASELDTPFLAHVQQIGQRIAATAQQAVLTAKQDVAAVKADVAAVSAPGTPAPPFPATKPPAPPAAGTPT